MTRDLCTFHEAIAADLANPFPCSPMRSRAGAPRGERIAVQCEPAMIRSLECSADLAVGDPDRTTRVPNTEIW